AVDMLHSSVFQKIALPSGLIAEVLEATYKRENTESLSAAGNAQYEIQQLIKALQQDETFDRGRMIAIEWGLLPLLDRETSDVGPVTLMQEVESAPTSFVHLLTLVYRGENEPPREDQLSEQEQIRARYARTLLDRIHRLPGTDDEGVLDYE